MSRSGALVLATSTPGSSGGAAAAAALAVAAAERNERGVLLVEVDGEGADRGPTLLASGTSRALEQVLTARLGEHQATTRIAARGRICWLSLRTAGAEDGLEQLSRVVQATPPASSIVAVLPAAMWQPALETSSLESSGGLVRADLPRERSLAALAVRELRERGLWARVAGKALGRVAARRALVGIDPGGAAAGRAGRWARALSPKLAAEGGQSLPAVLGAAFLLIMVALLLAAIGGAVSGRSRLQRAADLAAISAARSMRDDVDRLLSAPTRPDGSPNPSHLSLGEYLGRAREAARSAAERNGLPAGRLRVSFPDSDALAPVRVRTRALAELKTGALTGSAAGRSGQGAGEEIEATAEAQAVAPSGYSGAPTMATGGGYSGPLVYRQGFPMRPDVAQAFDLMAAAAAADGVSLAISSAFRSDAEQAVLWAANPDPTWVAPPGQSLHRCATELDVGPISAYGWLAANAPRFGFTKRYSWEDWHFGYDGGPPPCSEAGNSVPLNPGGDGHSAASGGLPGFVPSQFRGPITDSAARWNVSGAVLAAQLMAESNFNPAAVSPVGAQGIAQFMPGTAASYGLSDPFDAPAAIDAQAHLMSDLMGQFGSLPLALAAYNAGPGAVAACSCVPPYPETQAYVARILSLLDGAGAMAVPELEVRLVS